jgi:CheY-like chemotaxis protein
VNHVVHHSLGTPPATPLLALLAEGHADSRAMYAEFLKWCGYRLEEAGDGADALAKAIAFRPDVIITGIRLATLDGYELCSRLRAHPATATTPIVVLTGEAFNHQTRRAELAGASKVLVTPCLPDVLHREIEQLVQVSKRMRDGGSLLR